MVPGDRPGREGGTRGTPGAEPGASAMSEGALDRMRAEAAGRQPLSPPPPGGFPPPGREHGYYGQPILKPPVWTWEVPLYFFTGGTAGAAAVIAAGARVTGADLRLERAALAIAALLALASPVLLILDLGRPERFLNMLRVLKLRSPMSVGAWVLALFTPAVLAALAARMASGPPLLAVAGDLAEGAAALLGLVLATYTGVLLAVTAIPVWNSHRTLLPPHFAASALGSAAALLELTGFLTPATQTLGIVAAGFETAVGAVIELRHRREDRPLHHGRSGFMIRLGGVLAGPLALGLRVVAGDEETVRLLAALAFLAGAVITRYAWLAAGRQSAVDPGALFATQRRQGRTESSRGM